MTTGQASSAIQEASDPGTPAWKRQASTAGILALGVFLLAWLRPFGNSPDYESYEAYFDWIRLIDWAALTDGQYEPAFAALSISLVKVFSSNALVYALLATIAFLPKGWILWREGEGEAAAFSLAMLVYAIRFLPLHEMNQIRVAFASSCLLGAWALEQAGRRKEAIGLALASVAFHFSALIAAPLVFLRAERPRALLAWGLATFVGTRLAIGALISLLPPELGSLYIYEASGGFGDETPNPFAATVVLDWLAIAGGVWLWKDLVPAMRQILLVEVVAMGIYYGAREFPVFSHRPRELIAVFWVLYVAEGYRCGGLVRRYATAFAVASVLLYGYLFFLRGSFFS